MSTAWVWVKVSLTSISSPCWAVVEDEDADADADATNMARGAGRSGWVAASSQRCILDRACEEEETEKMTSGFAWSKATCVMAAGPGGAWWLG